MGWEKPFAAAAESDTACALPAATLVLAILTESEKVGDGVVEVGVLPDERRPLQLQARALATQRASRHIRSGGRRRMALVEFSNSRSSAGVLFDLRRRQSAPARSGLDAANGKKAACAG